MTALNDKAMLLELLSPVTGKAEMYADILLDRYENVMKLGEADVSSISETLDGDFKIASFIRISYALASRSVTDRFKFGYKHKREEIEEYFRALMMPLSVETVYVMSLDADGRVMACDYVSEGTVNFINVFPRRLAHTAVKRKASSVIVAHNHPGGYADASVDDVEATEFLKSLLLSSGIKLDAHYIIGGGRCLEMKL